MRVYIALLFQSNFQLNNNKRKYIEEAKTKF